MNYKNKYVVFAWNEDDNREVLASFDDLKDAQKFHQKNEGSDVEMYDPEHLYA